MTEESEHEEDGVKQIHRHSIPWRSESKFSYCVSLIFSELSKLVKKLQKRVPLPKVPTTPKIDKESSLLIQ